MSQIKDNRRMGSIMRIAVIVFFVMGAFVSCDRVGEDELEGKWQLGSVEEDGVTQVVDTVWYNFQGSLFQYQLYNAASDSYSSSTGYKDLTDDVLELELLSSSFISRTDWTDTKRTFYVEKCSSSKLILTSEGKTYTFRKF